ncbi:MAG: glycosyltransferase [Planctomycetes bacterium]|nr:glycosyltransferase [Planctomycetota bacterium]
MTPKVSVIIPTYNRAHLISEALESVFSQTYKNYEVIVVNDGSTDNTEEILNPYLERIKYIYKDNGGVASAKNTGINNSTAPYIAFLGSDDLWLPNKLETQVQYLEKHPESAMVFSWAEAFENDARGNRIRKFDLKYTDDDLSFRKLLRGNFIPDLTALFRRECLAKVGPFNEELKYGEDHEFWLRLVRHYPLARINSILALYRIHPANLIKYTDWLSRLNAQITVLRKISAQYPDVKEIQPAIQYLENIIRKQATDTFDVVMGGVGENIMARMSYLDNKLFPARTSRRRSYLRLANQIKTLLGGADQQPLGQEILAKYRQFKESLAPWGSRRRYIYEFFMRLIKRWIMKLAPALSRKSPATVLAVKDTRHFISVVIPIYDRTDVLKESIESILRQTYRNFELLLICDGSPPETMGIVNSYAVNPRVRIFRYNDNSGNATRGRNRGIKEAAGNYIAFMDSDDIALPNRLETSLAYIEDHNADVVYGGWQAKKEEGTDNPDILYLSNMSIIQPIDYDYQSLLKNNLLAQSTVMAKAEVLRMAGGLKPQMQYCEDYELWLRLAHLGYKFKSIPQPLSIIRFHSANLQEKFKANEKLWREKAIAEHKTISYLKPTVAFIIPSQIITGGTMVVCQHANILARKGYDVILIDNEIALSSKRITEWFPGLRPEVVSIKALRHNIDIAIATGWQTAYTLRDLPAERKLYFVQSDESRLNPPGSEESALAQQTYSFDFEFIAIAKWLRKWLKDAFGKNSVYVPNAIDTSIFYPDKPLEPKGDKLRVLLEGPINSPFKGMKEAFEVVADMDAEVWCVSTFGKPQPGWKCDRFFPGVPLEKMRRIYSSCDVLVKMSKVEGFFMPPLEMMACGGTVITNKVTGYDEYIVDGYNGLVVEQGDIKAAKEKLNQLIKDRNLLGKLIQGGAETVKKWYTWEASNDLLETVINPVRNTVPKNYPLMSS